MFFDWEETVLYRGDEELNSTLTSNGLDLEDLYSLPTDLHETIPKEVFNHTDNIIQVHNSSDCNVSQNLSINSNLIDNNISSVPNNPVVDMKYFVPTTTDTFEIDVPKDSDSDLDLSVCDEPDIVNVVSQDDLFHLVSLIPSLMKRCSALELKSSSLEKESSSWKDKFTSLEAKYSDLNVQFNSMKNEFSAHKAATAIKFNTVDQYSRSNALLIHNLVNVPRNTYGKQFSEYVAKELNKQFTSIQIKHTDIDVSHILYYAGPYSRNPVVVCKFVNRDLKNLYFDLASSRNYRGSLSLSDHLTPFNRTLYDKASALSHIESVWFHRSKRQLFAIVGGKRRAIVTEADLTSDTSLSLNPGTAENPSSDVSDPSSNGDAGQNRHPQYNNVPRSSQNSRPRKSYHTNRQSYNNRRKSQNGWNRNHQQTSKNKGGFSQKGKPPHYASYPNNQPLGSRNWQSTSSHQHNNQPTASSSLPTSNSTATPHGVLNAGSSATLPISSNNTGSNQPMNLNAVPNGLVANVSPPPLNLNLPPFINFPPPLLPPAFG